MQFALIAETWLHHAE